MTARSLLNSTRIAALRWRFRRMAGEMGVPGTIGVGVLASAVMYAVTALPPIGKGLDELKQAADRSAVVRQLPETVPDAQLMVLPQSFPARIDLLKWLDRLHEAAEGNQLGIDIGDYKLARDNPLFQTYELKFPVKADYPKLRGFLSQALADNPSLSLDQISFRRQKTSDSELSAEIKMTLYLKAD
jgi:hypothetical protein